MLVKWSVLCLNNNNNPVSLCFPWSALDLTLLSVTFDRKLDKNILLCSLLFGKSFLSGPSHITTGHVPPPDSFLPELWTWAWTNNGLLETINIFSCQSEFPLSVRQRSKHKQNSISLVGLTTLVREWQISMFVYYSPYNYIILVLDFPTTFPALVTPDILSSQKFDSFNLPL